jgi:hemoglobin/transferrin/lactoferrin receptor protein
VTRRLVTFSFSSLLLFSALPFVPSLDAADDTPQPAQAAPTRPEDIVYSVNRTPELASDTARAVTIITLDDIWRKSSRTLPEVLMEEAGVFVQQTNYGSGAPIIRGLIGKEILILIDGVKVNNAIYRAGPSQYLATIDLAMVERIEIVRGVVSVLGGDSLGGTINIITRKGATAEMKPGSHARFQGRYSSADQGFVGRAEAYGTAGRLRALGGGTYRTFDDVEGGGTVGRQIATGYDEGAANFFADFAFTQDKTLSFAYQALEMHDVPRTDRIMSGTNLKFNFDPQRLQLGTLAYQDLALGRFYDSLRLTASWNRQDEGRQEIRPNRPTQERRFIDRDTMFGATMEMTSSLGKSHRLLYGLDFSTEDILSRRNDVNLLTGASTAVRGNFTDGTTYESFAAYLQDQIALHPRLAVVIGGRFNYNSVTGSERSSLGTLTLDSSNSHPTGSLNAIFRATPHLHLVATATSGFRALNLDDLSVFDERPEGTEIPNPEVNPEKIRMYEGGVKYLDDKVSATALAYYSRLSDMLVRSAGIYQGLPYFDKNGNGRQDSGEPNVLQKQNTGQATIKGVELELRYRARPDLQVFGNFTATTGDDDVANQPLARIPPKYGTLGLRWSPSGKVKPWVELVYHFASAQRRLNPTDIADTRIGPGGTDGFNVLNLRTGLTLLDWVRGTFIVENLTDEKYKYHGSGIYRPGRQLVVSLETRF